MDDPARLAFTAAEPFTSVRVADGPYLQIEISAAENVEIDLWALVFNSMAPDARLSTRGDADGYA